MTRMSEVERHLAAELRARNERHQARWDDEARCFVVVSDTRPGVRYHLHVSAQVPASRTHALLMVACDCPHGQRVSQRPAGNAQCKHQARVMQRLQREGLARWDRGLRRMVAAGSLLDAALADHDARPRRNDPPTSVSGPGIPSRKVPQAEGDELARQIRMSL